MRSLFLRHSTCSRQGGREPSGTDDRYARPALRATPITDRQPTDLSRLPREGRRQGQAGGERGPDGAEAGGRHPAGRPPPKEGRGEETEAEPLVSYPARGGGDKPVHGGECSPCVRRRPLPTRRPVRL